MSKQLTVVKLPSEELSYTNCAIVNAKDFDKSVTKHIEVVTGPSNKFLFTFRVENSVAPGTVAFGALQRKWGMIGIDQRVDVIPFVFDLKNESINVITLTIDFLSKKFNTLDPHDSDKMASDFLQQFNNQAFSVGQQLAFQLLDQKKSFMVSVKEIEGADVRAAFEGRQSTHKKLKHGLLLPNSSIVFEKAEGSALNLTGKSKGKATNQSIINPDWDFNKLGIGGLDKEFSTIFRRAFASRVFPSEVIQQLGMKHVRGILLFGPPGTGKTLMARQIGKMLNAREPKIVNGPQILDKYVGESEANVRKLFAEAEEEEKRLGPNSGLHIIIFDEIDAICKSRGSVSGASGVHDTVVNQLLAKIDGVEQLNNILIIGMTNRKDMIDEALMRPGRLEVQLEISLPDERGRSQILSIHTARMKEYNKLGGDVDINEIAALTKNFSGAEIEGLVRAAQSSAMNRSIKATNKVEIDVNAAENLRVTRTDFIYALENDVKPAFGVSLEEFETYIRNGIISWGQPVRDVLDEGELRIEQAKMSEMTPLVSILLEGKPNTGKTALGAKIAMKSEFPFIKFCTPQNMISFSETAKSLAIKKVFDDAYKSQLSCLVIDDIESLLDYAPIGPRFSNLVLQTLKVLFKRQPPKGRKLLLIATTNEKELMKELGLYQTFSKVVHVANLSRGAEIMHVIDDLNCFNKQETDHLRRVMQNKNCCIGIKSLLDTVEFAKQAQDGYRTSKFLSALEEEGGLRDIDD